MAKKKCTCVAGTVLPVARARQIVFDDKKKEITQQPIEIVLNWSPFQWGANVASIARNKEEHMHFLAAIYGKCDLLPDDFQTARKSTTI